MPPRTVDCLYLDQPLVAAAYLLRDGDRAAFVDNNTARALPRLLGALADEGLTPAQVEHIVVTHVHLDHAGGTSALAAACPNATVLCHPRAARHLIDPSKLVASARAVYGDETFTALYGEIGPIAASRVRALEDGETFTLGARTLRVLHTRGHANHHMCILDADDGSIYTGDSFGLCYPRLQRSGLFIFPSTSPTDFDAAEARASVRRIVESGARTAYLAHFGGVSQLESAARQLLEHIDDAEAVLEAAAHSPLPDSELYAFCAARLGERFDEAMRRRGFSPGDDDREFLKLDLDLNAQGIAHVAIKRRQPRAVAP